MSRRKSLRVIALLLYGLAGLLGLSQVIVVALWASWSLGWQPEIFKPVKEAFEPLSVLFGLVLTGIVVITATIGRLVDAAANRDTPLLTPTFPEPQDLTPNIVGRDDELRKLRSLLRQEDVRLLTVTGPGGIGKTRLAQQVAADLRNDFNDGVFFVDLVSVKDRSQVASTIARTIGIRQTDGRSPLDNLKEYLRDKHLLIILDNFEAVVVVAAPIVDELLKAPRLKVLVTSRVVLNIGKERVFEVPQLALPPLDPLTPLKVLHGNGAVALFIQRAQARDDRFELTEANKLAVAKICHHLDGLPLAIELAAARIRLFSPQQMLAHIEREGRLSLTESNRRDLSARQQRMTDTIAWSYELLDAQGQDKALFRRLSVFVSDWTLEAAEAVCNVTGDLGMNVFARMESLVNQSLVQKEEHEDGEHRFRMLETIREYASDRLEKSGQVATIRRRHADYYRELAEGAEPKLRSAEQGWWLKRLETEYDNLRAALVWSQRDASGVAVGLQLAGAVWRYWKLRGLFSEGRQWLEPANVANSAVSDSIRAKALDGAGDLARQQGDYAASTAFHDNALGLFRQLGDKRGIARSIHGLGLVAQYTGDRQQAGERYERSLALFREVGDEHGVADVLADQGVMAREQNDPQRAMERLEESLAIFQRLGDRWSTALALNNLGLVARDQGNYDRAAKLYREGLHLFQELGDQWGIAWALHNLGDAELRKGDGKAATTYLEDSLALRRKIGDKRGIAWLFHTQGAVAQHQNDHDRAAVLYRESLVLFGEVGDKHGIASAIHSLGNVAYNQHVYDRAARLLGAAEALRGEVHITSSSDDRSITDPRVAAVPAEVREAFESAWMAGRGMAPSEAIADALNEVASP